MLYLDYSANTPVDTDVLEEFINATNKYIANPNSTHPLGIQAKEQILLTSELISSYFISSPESVIYTSGSTESNNLVIKGIAELNPGKKIIISEIEHSSIIAPCNYLLEKGYDIEIIPIKENGQIDLEILKETIDDNTCLVSICSVDSELGCIQPIKEISEIVKKYPNCYFHTDATQAMGKVKLDYTNVDFITFAPHKFFGMNGTGVLINKNDVKLAPQIHGGKSTTIYRSGTPVTANILALKKAFINAVDKYESEKTFEYVANLNGYLKSYFSNFENEISINSPETAIPHIFNISFKNIPIQTVLDVLNKNKIYVSTSSACSLENTPSKSVFAITKDLNLAKNSLRISLSEKVCFTDLAVLITIFTNYILEKN